MIVYFFLNYLLASLMWKKRKLNSPGVFVLFAQNLSPTEEFPKKFTEFVLLVLVISAPYLFLVFSILESNFATSSQK